MVTIIFKETLDSIQKKKQWKPTLQRIERIINSDDDCKVEWMPKMIRIIM